MDKSIENNNKSNENNSNNERNDENINEDNIEHNEDVNHTQNNNEDHNEEHNEESDNDVGDGAEGYLNMLYGEEEDRDGFGSDDDDNDSENSEQIDESIPESDLLPNNRTETQIYGTINSTIKSKKRRSSESDSTYSKRIKTEPTFSERSASKLTTTCIAVDEPEEDVETANEEIPNSSAEFMNYLLDLDANDLLSKEINDLPMARNLTDVSNCLTFDDFNKFCQIFIPFIIIDLLRNIKREYTSKQRESLRSKEFKHFQSILTKSKSNKMKNGLEIKCISITKPNESTVFKFGQLVAIRTAVQFKPDSNLHFITRNKYFGYVVSHIIREVNEENQTEVNHLRLLNVDKRDSIIIEEIILMTKFSDDLYTRNDALIIAEPILDIHNSYLEARAIFKFQQFPLWQQIFNPTFNTKASGVLVNINKSQQFDETQRECIQIAIDVVANSSLNNSCFLAINGSQGSGKTLLLTEIVKQLVNCEQFKQSKVLFTSSDYNCLKNVNQILKTNRINTTFIDNNIDSTFKKSALKYIRYKLAKDLDETKKLHYEDCLDYFESNMTTELSVKSALFKNAICDQLKHDLMTKSNVIIGRIEDLCNDIIFYKYFSSDSMFSSCIIDDAMGVTEPQLYSLFWFGIKKFIFAADFNDSNEDLRDNCRRLGLSRSFFSRYYSLCPQNTSNQLTVFNI